MMLIGSTQGAASCSKQASVAPRLGASPHQTLLNLSTPALSTPTGCAGVQRSSGAVRPRHDSAGRQRKSGIAHAASALATTATYTSVLPGQPSPLGPSAQDNAINFALYAKFAKTVTLLLYTADNKFIEEVQVTKKTGDVWHVALADLPREGVCYAYRVNGDGGWDTGLRWDPKRVLLDPYAPLVSSRRVYGVRDDIEQFKGQAGSLFLGTYDFASPAFDWGDDSSREVKGLKDLIVYEMPVRSFTANESSGLPPGERGTFKGVASKAQYLADLGVTAVELLPVFEWDEFEFQRTPNPRDHMINIWGYSHISFFAPMSRFAANGAGPAAAAREFKEMVKTLHAKGIEVLLDVVYNHTVEGGDTDPYTLSFRGIENKTYYMCDTSQYVQMLNYSGCGNTVNANHPVVSKLIIDSLVHWVTEYHVDGFRFDLASCLCRDDKGKPLPAPPLIRDISKHPILRNVKLIAEPWDLGMYQVGSFPSWDIWAEWNGKYRDDVRKFIKGDAGMKRALATRLCGSADLYQHHNRKPYHSVNFIIAHDGFSLYDLVSYNGKHNDANGEGNRDGTNDNFSWNCGAEGPTSDAGINALRQRQMRNAMVLLMLSAGTPMLVMGDECAVTHNGNNNFYGHDQPWTQMPWNLGDSQAGMLRFTRELLQLRQTHPVLRREDFFGPGDITWHESNWEDDESRFLACTLHDKKGGQDLYAAFNAHGFQVSVTLPPAPSGKKWCRLIDTNLPVPRDFTPGGNKGVEPSYGVAPFSSIVLMAK